MFREYYCPGGQHVDGPIIEYHFRWGCVKLVNGKVIGGEVAFKDRDNVVEVYVLNKSVLSIFRPSVELYKSKGYATERCLRTYGIPFTRDRIERILKKTYKEYKHVDEFMKLAREIFYSQDLDKQFDYRGDFIYDN